MTTLASTTITVLSLSVSKSVSLYLSLSSVCVSLYVLLCMSPIPIYTLCPERGEKGDGARESWGRTGISAEVPRTRVKDRMNE